MEGNHIDLRDRFKKIRIKKDIEGLIKEQDVAYKLGLSQANFNKILKTGTNLKVFREVCQLFDITLDELFSGGAESIENIVNEPQAEYQITKPSNLNLDDTMNELIFYKEQNELLKENNKMQKEKIVRLEVDLKKCQESNRVYSH
jgi:transcriptional regulator with XRE-family HTH domain